MYFYLIQYVRCYVLFLLSHHLNQNVTENTSLKASLGLHQGCFPRRPMHLNSMLLSLSHGIKTTITVSDKSSRGLRSISIIHGSQHRNVSGNEQCHLNNILYPALPLQTVNPVISSPAPGSSLECGYSL